MITQIERRSPLPTAESKYIRRGNDSLVYRVDDKVMKVYRPRLPLERIRFYQDVTNIAASCLISHPYSGEMEIDDITFPFTYSVVPILEVREDTGTGRIAAISDYIAGPSFYDVSSARRISINRYQIEAIEESEEREFLQGQLIDQYDMSKKSLDEQLHHRGNLAAFFNRELGVNGIEIARNNVKIRADVERRKLRFVVTDLCGSVGKLRYA